MKIIFFGLGSIGRRHANLLKNNFNHEIFAYRSNRKSEKNKFGFQEIYNIKDIDEINPDIAFITNPTSKHVKTALFCADKGINIFLEKPLSNNKKDLKELKEIAKKNNVYIYVAYCFRFHPAICWLKKHLEKNNAIHININNSSYLPNWRESNNHLNNYSASKKMGGGVILDLSHEIDYIYHLFGDVKNIKSNSKKIGKVTVDSEDFADILLELNNKVFCNIHLNFLSRLKKREIIVDFNDHTVFADLISNKILIFNDNTQEEVEFGNKLDDMYLAQLEYFFKKIKKGEMMNQLSEAMEVFDIIIDVKKAARK